MSSARAQTESAMWKLHREVEALEREIAQLKAPPTLVITRDAQGHYQHMVRMRFEWRGFRHDTLVDKQLYDSESQYKAHVLHAGVEATIRAFADVELPRMVVEERSDPEFGPPQAD